MEKNRLDVLGKLAPYMEKVQLDPYLTLHPGRAQGGSNTQLRKVRPRSQRRDVDLWGPLSLHIGMGLQWEWKSTNKTSSDDSLYPNKESLLSLTEQRPRGRRYSQFKQGIDIGNTYCIHLYF